MPIFLVIERIESASAWSTALVNNWTFSKIVVIKSATWAIIYSIKAISKSNNEIIITNKANCGNNARKSGIQTLNNLLIALTSLNGFFKEHKTSIIHRIMFNTGRKKVYKYKNGVNFSNNEITPSKRDLEYSGLNSGFNVPGGNAKDNRSNIDFKLGISVLGPKGGNGTLGATIPLGLPIGGGLTTGSVTHAAI